MNFKSSILGLLITTLSLSGFAQKSEVSAAKGNLDSYLTMSRNNSKIAEGFKTKAKESIEKAIVHEKTKSDPELWAMRAALYSEMAFNDSTAAADGFIKEAQSSIAKAKELDATADTKENIKKAKNALYQKQLVKGNKLLEGKKYEAAYTELSKGMEYMPGDTLLNYLAGISAQNSNNYTAAIKSYSDLLTTNFSYNNEIYNNLAQVQMVVKDTAAALKTLTEATAKYPKNTQLLTTATEIRLNSKKYNDVITSLETQMQNHPDNKLLPYYLGIAYSSTDQSIKAEEAYKKAIALDPNNADIYINVGSVIMNNGVDIQNSAAKQFGGKKLTPAQLAKYNEIKKKADAEFDRSLPYLLKATELDPKSRIAWSNLKAYYQAKNNQAKILEVHAKLKAL